jgi:hypothetical protein
MLLSIICKSPSFFTSRFILPAIFPFHLVTFSFWLGSQAVGQPLCTYRLILPFDDGKFINVGSNIDFSQVDGEVKVPIASNILSKTTFAVSFLEHSISLINSLFLSSYLFSRLSASF